MKTPRTPRKRKAPLTKISLPWVGIVIGVIVINLLIRHYFFNAKKADKGPTLQAQAIEQAQQVIRKKLGDSLSITFPKKAEIQEKDSARYWVGGNVITKNKGNQEQQRPWMVTLQYQKDEDDANRWKVISSAVGE
jgi:preprotein translocase subunit SecF